MGIEEPGTGDEPIEIGSPLDLQNLFTGAVEKPRLFVAITKLPLASSLACFQVGKASSSHQMSRHR